MFLKELEVDSLLSNVLKVAVTVAGVFNIQSIKVIWQEGGHDNCLDGPRSITYEYAQGSFYIKSGYFVPYMYSLPH
jgi:hypothetical protein